MKISWRILYHRQNITTLNIKLTDFSFDHKMKSTCSSAVSDLSLCSSLFLTGDMLLILTGDMLILTGDMLFLTGDMLFLIGEGVMFIFVTGLFSTSGLMFSASRS